jgi:hypothetical protein
MAAFRFAAKYHSAVLCCSLVPALTERVIEFYGKRSSAANKARMIAAAWRGWSVATEIVVVAS